MTQKGLLGDLDGATQNREASFAIGVKETVFSDSVSAYREVEKDKIVCAFEDDGLPLEVAYKVARTRTLLNSRRDGNKETDTTLICRVMDKIRNDLNARQGIKAKLTSIANTSDKIDKDIESLRENIKRSLMEIHTLLKSPSH